VVSDQAVAIGITALPTPVTDSQSGLFFQYNWIFSDYTLSSAVGIASVSKSLDIDSRAMRKVEEGQDVVEVMESGTITSGLTLRGFTRLLVKLH
jgi:uncharacterized protein (DUF2147 family)